MRLKTIAVKFLASFGIITVLMAGGVALFVQPVQAACSITEGLGGGIDCATPKGVSQRDLFEGDSLFKVIANTLIMVIGAISVIMVIIGGLRYALSGGNPQATKDAKDTVLYAVIGVVVAVMAFAIVNFVIVRFTNI